VTDPGVLALAGAATAALGLAAAAALRAWHGWLELRRLEIARCGPAPAAGRGAAADLRELRARLRRLEAIADGRPA
jgi:hypothetical protein